MEGADPDLRQGGGLEKQSLQPPWISHLGPPPALPASARGPRGILFLFTPYSKALKPPSTHRKQHHRLLKRGENTPLSAAEHPGSLCYQRRETGTIRSSLSSKSDILEAFSSLC